MLHSRRLLQTIGLSCAAWMLYSAGAVLAVELSPSDKSRVARLDKMAASLEEVNVEKKTDTGDRRSSGRRASKVSELRFRFVRCVSGTINDGKDGMLLFPLQISGFSSEISPGSKPKRNSGSAHVKVRVIFKGLIGEKTPKAEIDLPPFKHGSSFPAADLVRDEIQKRIERFLPEVEITGRQRRREKYLKIVNKTEEPLRVFVHRRTQQFDEEKGYQWMWLPSGPGERPAVLTVAAGKSEMLMTVENEQPTTAQRVRIWAETESGQRLDRHQDEDLWMVKKNPDFEDSRVYYSEKIATHTHTFEAPEGPQVFTERVLRMKNEAPAELSVTLDYRTTEGGQVAWRKARFDIRPNASVEPRDHLGMRIRASRIRFSARSENRRYETHQDSDLWLVEEANGRRAYQADEIGEFEYLFLARTGGNTATVTADNVDVKSGSKTVGSVSRGDKFDVLEQRGDWTRIALNSGGKTTMGWVHQRNLKLSRPEIASTPASSRPRFRATSSNADLKVGQSTIARIPPGQEYDVLEEKDGWVRIQVKLSGQVRHGWVRTIHGVVSPTK